MDELELIKNRKLREMMKRKSSKTDESSADMPIGPIELSDDTFEEVVHKHPLVVVDCWANWCSPCRMVAPVVEELARDYRGKIVFGKLDVDSNVTTSQKYGIMSIPTLLVFKNGQLVDQIVGAMPRSILEPKLLQHV